MKGQNIMISWNWCAFLVGPYWFIYRKMYGYGAAILAGIIVLSLINEVLITLMLLSGYIALGVFGNYIYMDHIYKLAEVGRYMTEPYKMKFILKNSGVNSTATTLTIVGHFILSLIISFL